ncbi:VOC family protein [Microbispora bryophytorum]|uniref:VOC family protein n=1 Tax=Microbispora bryophytorum TaxID=1460882 RepID=UPI0033FB6FF6
MAVRRVLAFVDRPRERFEAAAPFWTAVTGTRLSSRRGDDGEFATLLPQSGDACVKLQAVGDGGGAHLDLEVDDVRASMTRAVALGAAVADYHGDWAVLRSPRAGRSASSRGRVRPGGRRCSPAPASTRSASTSRPTRTRRRRRSGRR